MSTKIKLILFIFFISFTQSLFAQQSKKPLRVGVAGLTHGHVGWILNYKRVA